MILAINACNVSNSNWQKNRPDSEDSYANVNKLGIALCKIIMTTTKVDRAPEKHFQFIHKT